MKISSLMLFAFVVPSLSFAETASDELMLECKMNEGGNSTFVIVPGSGKAILVLPDSTVSGQLIQSKEHYTLIFPKTTNRWETRVIVERYTGSLVWEHGTPPFGQGSLNNAHRSGVCNKGKARRKF